MANTLPEIHSLPEIAAPAELVRCHPGERLLFAFDFDGTLTSIVDHPDLVTLRSDVGQALLKISKKWPLLMLTGRASKDLKRYIPSELDVIGSHGADQCFFDRSRDEELWLVRKPEIQAQILKQIELHGGILEDKSLSLTIHYRLEGTEYWGNRAGTAWLSELAEAAGVQLVSGNMCWNLMAEGVSKGVALSRYAAQKEATVIVYFGDEPTDETVFELQDLVKYSVKVGPTQGTRARYQIADVEAVQSWVLELSDLA